MDSTVTLLIPTRNRPSSVDLLLSSLKVHGYLQRQGFSVLVADDSSDNATADICQKYQVNHLSGLHQGKSAAMNLAIEHITSEFVAFFDDDIVVLDDQWLDKILRNFISDDIAYVSGKVVAYELTTPAQIKWEKKGALNKGDHRLELGSEFFHKPRLIGVPLTLFTMGANHIVRKQVLDLVGAHDARFGPGCSVGGASGDLDLSYKILRQGFTVIYDPEAKVAHCHPEEMSDLYSKIFQYGVADTAIHTKFLIEFGDLRSAGQLLFRPSQQFWRFIRSLVGQYPLPPTVLLGGIAGNFIGPFAYLKVAITERARRAQHGFQT